MQALVLGEQRRIDAARLQGAAQGIGKRLRRAVVLHAFRHQFASGQVIGQGIAIHLDQRCLYFCHAPINRFVARRTQLETFPETPTGSQRKVAVRFNGVPLLESYRMPNTQMGPGGLVRS